MMKSVGSLAMRLWEHFFVSNYVVDLLANNVFQFFCTTTFYIQNLLAILVSDKVQIWVLHFQLRLKFEFWQTNVLKNMKKTGRILS